MDHCEPLPLLLVGFDDEEAGYVRRDFARLRRSSCPSWIVVPEVAAAVHAVAGSAVAAVVLPSAGKGGGLAARITEVRQTLPQLPLVVLCQDQQEDEVLAALRHGAHECLPRGQWTPAALEQAVGRARERHATEAGLRAKEEFFRRISENVTDLIAVIDRDGRRLYNSPSYRNTFGSDTALSGTDSFAEIHPDDRERIREIFRRSMETGEGQKTEYRLVLRSGGVRYIESIGSVVPDERGEPSKVVVVSRDVTEWREAMRRLEQALGDLREAQQRLLQSGKLEAVSTFAAAIAHEVKNPLQTILLGIDFFRGDNGSNDPNVALVLTEMETAARKADAVIRGLLEFAAYGKHDLRDQDVNPILERALETVRPELASHEVRCEIRLASDLPQLRLDARKIQHVFLKLLLGAIPCLPRGAGLTVRTRLEGDSPHPTQTTGVARRVAVHFEGEGLAEMAPAETAGQAFGAQRVHRGALDLMVIRKVVEFFGGTVQAATQGGRRGRVTIAFRVAGA